jgi:hypothetical protein
MALVFVAPKAKHPHTGQRGAPGQLRSGAGDLGFGQPGCGHLVCHRRLWIGHVPWPDALAGAVCAVIDSLVVYAAQGESRGTRGNVARRIATASHAAGSGSL